MMEEILCQVILEKSTDSVSSTYLVLFEIFILIEVPFARQINLDLISQAF